MINNNEKNYTNALIITAFEDYVQVKSNLDIYTKYFLCYLHIDDKSLFSEEQLAELNSMNNVFAIKRYEINWGSYKHIEAILDLCRKALECEAICRFHIISAKDFLSKSPAQIIIFFENNNNNYLEMKKINAENGYSDRYRYYYFLHKMRYNDITYKLPVIVTHIQKILHIRRKINNKFYYKGLIWCSLTRNAIEYTFDFLLKNPTYLKELRYCYVPEEFFFQNIFIFSPFRDTVVNDCLRYDLWGIEGRGNPAVLNKDDFNCIIQSNAIFARKIDVQESKSLVEKLTKYLEL